MTEKIKFIITIGLVVTLAISTFTNFQIYNAKKAIERQRDQLKNENDTLVKKIEEAIQERKRLQEKIELLNKVSQEKEDIQKRYEMITKEKDSLSEKLGALENDNKQLNKRLQELTQEKQKLEEKFETGLTPVKNENRILKLQLGSLSKRKINLENKLRKMQEDNSDLEKRLNETSAYLENRLSKTVELPQIVVYSQSDKPPAKKKGPEARLEGTILDVNKENNFVVIDLGQDAGINEGETFRVYRHGQGIATLEVIQVRKSIAACDIKEETLPIAAGDTVR